jgi:hypothetical protein
MTAARKQESDMRDVVLQMGISIDGYVSGGPGGDIGGGEPEHADVVARKTNEVAKLKYPDGTVISFYRRPR